MSPSRKGDEKAISVGRKFNTGTNFMAWLFIFGIICLLIGFVNLYLTFNIPPLDFNPPLDFLFGYLGWSQNWNMYLYKAAVFLLASAAIFLTIIYMKHVKGWSYH